MTFFFNKKKEKPFFDKVLPTDVISKDAALLQFKLTKKNTFLNKSSTYLFFDKFCVCYKVIFFLFTKTLI